jgi:hypothetical protein
LALRALFHSLCSLWNGVVTTSANCILKINKKALVVIKQQGLSYLSSIFDHSSRDSFFAKKALLICETLPPRPEFFRSVSREKVSKDSPIYQKAALNLGKSQHVISIE